MFVECCTLTNNVGEDSGMCIYNSGFITLEKSIVSGNHYLNAGAGGGVYNDKGTLIVSRCSLTENKAVAGAGIWNGGNLVVIDSTLAQNAANYSSGPCPGGGIYNNTNATALIVNATISENSAFNQGGGIMNLGSLWLLNGTLSSNTVVGILADGPLAGGGVWNSGRVYSKNTIVAGNSAPQQGPDFFGTLTSQGYNLIQDTTDCTIAGVTTGNLLGVDPLLGPLQDNGGPTYTQALLQGSPALNAGTSVGAPLTDQRGVLRPQGPGVDIGAFEVHYVNGQPVF
jgi:hypothetical protein